MKMPTKNPFIVLVTGILKRDSGKTSFCSYLTKLLSGYNADVIPFKPLSGHNFFYQISNTYANVKIGNIVSQDIQQLVNLVDLKTSLPIEILNPSHVLFAEKTLYTYINQEMAGAFFSLPFRSIPLMQRFSFIENSDSNAKKPKFNHTYVIRNEERNPDPRFAVDDSILPELYNKATEIIPVKDNDNFVKMSRELIKRSVVSCLRMIIKKLPDVIIVEGFNNVAIPCSESEFINKISAVLAVSPGCLLAFETKKFFKTIKALSGYNKLLGTITTEKIIEFLKPEEIFKLPASIGVMEPNGGDTKKLNTFLTTISGAA